MGQPCRTAAVYGPKDLHIPGLLRLLRISHLRLQHTFCWVQTLQASSAQCCLNKPDCCLWGPQALHLGSSDAVTRLNSQRYQGCAVCYRTRTNYDLHLEHWSRSLHNTGDLKQCSTCLLVAVDSHSCTVSVVHQRQCCDAHVRKCTDTGFSA